MVGDPETMGLLGRPWYRRYALGVLVAVFTSSQAFVGFYATLGMPIAMLADRSNRRNVIHG